MTTALDRIAGPLAENLLAQFGKPAVLRRTVSVFNPATGANTVTTTNYNIKCFPEAVPTRLIDGTTVRLGDVQILMSGVGVEPSEQTDAVVLNGTAYPVYRVAPTYSGTKAALYTVFARR